MKKVGETSCKEKNISKCKKKDLELFKKVRKQVKPKLIFCMPD